MPRTSSDGSTTPWSGFLELLGSAPRTPRSRRSSFPPRCRRRVGAATGARLGAGAAAGAPVGTGRRPGAAASAVMTTDQRACFGSNAA